MSKRDLIDLTKQFLRQEGITDDSYIISLQGPTFIFTSGIKLATGIKKKLKEAGVLVMGG
jgi:hypothetical protein